jgi:hypothetical protein
VKEREVLVAQLSSRGQRLLAEARRLYPPKDREAVVRKLKGVKRPALGAVLDFEELFGGIEYTSSEGTFTFGIDYSAPEPYPDQPEDPELSMVPIGRGQSGFVRYYMNDLGEVAERPDNEGAVTMKHVSFLHLIEHQAMQTVRRRPDPFFFVEIVPPVGEHLAATLGLRPVMEASDRYEAWWEDELCSVQQILFSGNWRSELTRLSTHDLTALVRGMNQACAVAPTARFRIAALPTRETRRTKREPWPEIDSLQSAPGTKWYAYGERADYIYGTIWAIPEDGQYTLQQYRCFKGWSDKSELRGWDTFTNQGGISREAR